MMKTFVFTIVLLAVLVIFIKDVFCMPPHKGVIGLSLVSAHCCSAVIQYRGFDVTLVDKCELSYKLDSVQTGTILLDYAPLNYTVDLRRLQPNSTYQFMMVCWTKKDAVEFSSQQLVFATTVIEHQSQNETGSTGYVGFDTTPTTVNKIKMKTTTSSHDILGIVFGLAGFGVIFAFSYAYCRFRQRRRVQRFLQFRNHNEDVFPNMSPIEDDDDNLVT